MYYRLLILIVAIGIQAEQQPPAPLWNDLGALTLAEISQLEKADKVDKRIRIFETASARILGSIRSEVQKNQFTTVPGQLRSWSDFLFTTLKDIEVSVDRKKKSKALIRYEIHLRKAISEVKEWKIDSPHDLQDSFDAWLAQAEDVRKKCIDILFQRRGPGR